MFRDTLRDPSEVDGESDAGSEHSDATEVSPKKKKKKKKKKSSRSSKDANSPDLKNLVLFHEDGSPDPQHVHLPWKIRDPPHDGRPIYVHTITGRHCFTHPMMRKDRKSGKTRRTPRRLKA